jgi:acetylglutamate kinase
MPKISKPEYEAKVRALSEEEAERLLSRMSGKLPKRLHKEKLTREEALAIQLEVEDEQLQEWRKNMKALHTHIEETGKFKSMAAQKSKK